MIRIKRALISVSDKRGVVEFARGLRKQGVEIISTGGTAKLLRAGGIKSKAVSDLTGYPEILSGRVKTLHPSVHGGILARRSDAGHLNQVRRRKIPLIDLVVVNLYPFEETAGKPNVALEDAVEMIDIGGPAMIRSAAKNFKDVAVVSNPKMYGRVLKELEDNGCALSEETAAALAVEAFAMTSRYDALICGFLNRRLKAGDEFPEELCLLFGKLESLRYGENPHQKASFYAGPSAKPRGLAAMRKFHGKELSFNNILDLNAALVVVRDFDSPCACIIKHDSPCGVAVSDELREAYRQAFKCDSEAAFGGVVGLNRKVDAKVAKEIISSGFLECVLAPGYDKGAVEVLKTRKNLRVVEISPAHMRAETRGTSAETSADLYSCDMKKVEGGLLLQQPDEERIAAGDLEVVTKRKPSKEELKSLLFAWTVAKHVKSNAIVIAKRGRSVGIGGGQPSRVESVRIAVRKAGKEAALACLASDGFFPKPDSIELAAKAGVSAIIQPGGSIKDEDVIASADKAGIAMVFTGMRHFRH